VNAPPIAPNWHLEETVQLTPTALRHSVLILTACVSACVLASAALPGDAARSGALLLIAASIATALLALYHRLRPQSRQEPVAGEQDLLLKISHELRTPLSTLAGYLELLCDGHAGPLSDDQRALAEIAASNTARLEMVVENLLEMATIDPAMIIGYLARPRPKPLLVLS
jgi:signal transduction histidine kinase